MADPVYAKVATTFIDSFVYAESGLVDGDWTRQVSKNGVNVSTPPGIVITNVADNRYSVSISGSTGFVSATGTYQLVIYKTAIPFDKRDAILVVTTDGLPSGTTGTVSFTPSTSDGRITDGTSPLSGATITIRRPSGALYVQVTSDINGLWPTVAFDQTGTFTATVQKSGYTIASFNIVVTSLTATGPGTDIVLASIGLGSGISLSALGSYARRMFVDRQGPQANIVVTEAVNEALTDICSAHNWTYLYTVGRITLQPAYTTGTISVTEGSPIVTLTGGTFPAWAEDGDINIGGVWTPVLTLTNSTTLVMTDEFAGATNASMSFILCKYRYDLPSDCRNLINVAQVPQWIWGTSPVGRYELEQLRVINAGVIPVYAIQKNQICIWPYMTGATTLPANLLYIRMPAPLVSGPDEADFDPLQLPLIHKFIDYAIACRGSCVAGDKAACFKARNDALAIAVGNERTASRVGFGWNGGAYRTTIPSTGNRYTS